jgi:TonB family protein
MKRLLVALAVAVAAASTLSGGLGAARGPAPAQATTQGEVVPTRLAPPVYPPIAASARVSGEVEVSVGVAPDGRVESAVIVRGVPLLDAAALDAARRSEFECRNCVAPVTHYSLVFAFLLDDPNRPPVGPPQPEHAGAAPNRLVVVAPAQPIHILFSSYPVRSVKCLFLWPCGRRWGGLDFYCTRVRSRRCLWLWNCADSCPSSRPD